jgi:hypothetical protein
MGACDSFPYAAPKADDLQGWAVCLPQLNATSGLAQFPKMGLPEIPDC